MDTIKLITKILISMFAGVLLFISVTYAYFLAQISGLESISTVYMSSGTLSINYTKGSEDIILANVMPGVSETKIFTLTGINDTKESKLLNYNIGILKEENTFSDNAIKYSLEFDETTSTKQTNDIVITNTINGGLTTGQGTQYIATGSFSNTTTGINHVYNMTISFPETGEDQSEDEGKIFKGRVIIELDNE